MRRLTALGAVVLMLVTMGGAALAQGLSDVRLGNEAFREGDFAAAVSHYTDAIRSGELAGEALAITYNNRGVAHGEAGDFDPAIADYTQALALRPGDATTIRNLRVAHVRRGEVSFASGAYDSAAADFTRASELEPDHHLAFQRLGELYAELGLLDLAIADLERAAQLNPGDPETVEVLDRVTRQRDAVMAAAERQPTAPEPSLPVAGIEALGASTGAAFEAMDKVVEPDTAPPDAATTPAAAAALAPPSPPAADLAQEAPTSEASIAAAAPAPAPAALPPEPEPAAAPLSVQGTGESPEPAAGPVVAAVGEPYRVISAVNYRAGPANDAARLGTVDEGLVVQVTGDTLGWKHVILPNGDRGFIYGSWLEPAAD